MKLSVTASALKDALAVASRATARNGIIPATSQVLVSATTDLTITGTDLRVRAWRAVPADVDETGAVLLPPRALADFVDAVPSDGAVTIESDAKHKATLACGRATARVSGLDPEAFPAPPSFDDPVADMTVDAPTLARLVGSVAHACADSDSAQRPILAGISVTAAGGKLTVAAADGYRLAVRSVEIDGLPDISVIAEGERLTEAAARVARTASVRLAIDANRSGLLIESEAGCWAVALIDGQFPDFRRVIPDPASVKTVATVQRADLARSLRLIGGITQEGRAAADGKKLGRVTFARVSVRSGSVTVAARDQGGDQEAASTFDADVTGTDQDITFNGGYLKDAVDALDEDRVAIELVGPTLPGVLREAGERNGHLQIAMPMHIPGGKS